MKKEIINTIVKKSTKAVRQTGADETKNALEVFKKQFENFSKNKQKKVKLIYIFLSILTLLSKSWSTERRAKTY